MGRHGYQLNGPEGGAVRRLTWLGSVHSLYLSLQHAQERFLVRSKVMKFVLGGGKAVLSVKECVCVDLLAAGTSSWYSRHCLATVRSHAGYVCLCSQSSILERTYADGIGCHVRLLHYIVSRNNLEREKEGGRE